MAIIFKAIGGKTPDTTFILIVRKVLVYSGAFLYYTTVELIDHENTSYFYKEIQHI